MKYLGIDYGKRKVGLAISEGLSAAPFKVVEVSSLADAVQKIVQIIEQEAIDMIVIGLAESGESRNMTEHFIKELKEKGIEVIIVEETLSSHRADKQLQELGVAKSKKGANDAAAAAIILEDYLDSLI